MGPGGNPGTLGGGGGGGAHSRGEGVWDTSTGRGGEVVGIKTPPRGKSEGGGIKAPSS